MQATGLEELKSTSESVLVEISHPLIKVTVRVKDGAIGFLYAKMSFLTHTISQENCKEIKIFITPVVFSHCTPLSD